MIDTVLASARVYGVEEMQAVNPETGNSETITVSKLKVQAIAGGACSAGVGGEMKIPVSLPFGKNFLLVLRDADAVPLAEAASGRKFNDEGF